MRTLATILLASLLLLGCGREECRPACVVNDALRSCDPACSARFSWSDEIRKAQERLDLEELRSQERIEATRLQLQRDQLRLREMELLLGSECFEDYDPSPEGELP